MAEVVGLVASIIAICELGGKTVKVSRILLEIARSAPFLQDEIEQIAHPLQLSGSAIKNAYEQLQSLDIRDGNSLVSRHMRKNNVAKNLHICAKEVMEKLSYFLEEVLSLTDTWKWLAAYKWYKSKARFNAIGIMVESVKSSMTLLMHSAHLEILQNQSTNGAETQQGHIYSVM
jgi:hypothetical protein